MSKHIMFSHENVAKKVNEMRNPEITKTVINSLKIDRVIHMEIKLKMKK